MYQSNLDQNGPMLFRANIVYLQRNIVIARKTREQYPDNEKLQAVRQVFSLDYYTYKDNVYI